MADENSSLNLYNTQLSQFSINGIDDSQLVGVPVAVAGDSLIGIKKKRGRPPKGQPKPPPCKRKKDEEDVCFICFDGGSLVLCDRRSCPKAYHPTCIKRDEAFFRSKARWDCGWHICSKCQKAAHYMCYTCTYSLCKGCTKDAEYLCVRGDKGFCMTCMKTVMLIENNGQGNKEMAQVDFDDKTSWEYLFKVYWIYLKEKLSLTSTELAQAKNPWKGIDTTMSYKKQSPGLYYGTIDVKNPRPSGHQEAGTPTRTTTKEQQMILNNDSLSMEKPGCQNNTSLTGSTEWATKELLEFVAHMKNGDVSVLSQFDVQALLLDYIKRNNLRVPRRKSQIVCDSRLQILFGKPHVGHFEMLKLLETHFFMKDEPRRDVFVQAGVVDAGANKVETDGYSANLLMIAKDNKRKTRRKGEDRAMQINLDQYAAINVHNINLIYLRRNVMENLIEDNENFHNKVVDSFVRIRISSSEQKQDMYRLVQVVGTTKVDVPYKIGNRTTSVMLEVLNLDKKEAIAIDEVSNQDFSEEECKRLRQSTRNGLVKQWTVGEIQEKAMDLQAVKLNDWLETETLRLNHLLDRESENGRKNELRECIEEIQLLKTPEERERRLREIPQVHPDPYADPMFDSLADANDKKQGERVKSRYSGAIKKGSKPISPRRDKEEILLAKSLERVNEGKNASETSTPPLSTENTSSANNSGTARLWHYRDPKGNIQGPFSLVQLQKWSTYFPPDMRIWVGDIQDKSLLLTDALNGRFHKASPLQSQEAGVSSDSKLCNSDVGWCESANSPVGESKQTEIHSSDNKELVRSDSKQTEIHSPDNNELVRSDGKQTEIHSPDNNELVRSDGKQTEIHPPDNNELVRSDGKQTETHSPDNNELVRSDGKQTETHSSENDELVRSDGKQTEIHSSDNNELVRSDGKQTEIHPSDNNGLVRSDGWDPQSSSWATPVISYSKEIQTGSSSQHWNSDPNNGNWSSHGPTMFRESQSNNQGLNLRPLPVNFSSSNIDSTSCIASVSKSTDSSEQNADMDISNVHSHTAPKNKQCMPPNILVQDSDIPNMPDSTPKTSDEDQKGQAAENEQSLPSNFHVQDSGPSWSGASSLVVDVAQLPERIEFSTLAEESVSDLLAEVDAMESQGGLPSPTSVMKDLMNCPKDDCFGSIDEDFSPTPDPVKSDALSSTADVRLTCRSSITDELFGASPVDVFDPVPRCSGQISSTSPDVDGETKSTDVAVQQPSIRAAEVEGETKSTDVLGDLLEGSYILLAMKQDMADSGIGRRAGSEAMATGWGTLQEPSMGAQVERETKSTGEAGTFTQSQNRVESDVVINWGTMQQPSAKTKAEGKLKSTDFLGNHKGYSENGLTRNMVDLNVARRAGLEAVDTGSRAMQQSYTAADVEEGEIKSSDVPFNQEEDARMAPNQYNFDLSISRRAESEATDSGWGNINLGLGISDQGNSNSGWGTNQGIARGTTNMSHGPSVGSVGREVQRKHGGERFTSHRDHIADKYTSPRDHGGERFSSSLREQGGERFTSPREQGGEKFTSPRDHIGERFTSPRDRGSQGQGGNSEFSRGKSSWSRQSYGGSGGGGYSRPSSKGQRICKYHESGRCKKGSSCNYLHP